MWLLRYSTRHIAVYVCMRLRFLCLWSFYLLTVHTYLCTRVHTYWISACGIITQHSTFIILCPRLQVLGTRTGGVEL
ncbi:hypothetical protein DFH27DRAFT_535368, partial [Peziza echinospora]